MKFYIKQKVFTFKDKFTILDEQQNIQYQIKGKFMSLRNKLELNNNKNEVILRSNRKVLSLLPRYYIYDSKNQATAMVKKLFALRPKFDLRILSKDYHVDGNFFGHSFGIYDDKNNFVASISKRLISWGDTYEIDIADEQNVEILLFMVIIIDQVVHERKNR